MVISKNKNDQVYHYYTGDMEDIKKGNGDKNEEH
jgi:hypothetical protein